MSTSPMPSAGPDAPVVLVVLLHQRHGSLERLLGAARRQGCDVTTLALEPDEHAGLVRVSLTIRGGHPARLAQQLTRIVDVIDVHDATPAGAAPPPPSPELAVTPLHAQADGESPGDDSAPPTVLTED